MKEIRGLLLGGFATCLWASFYVVGRWLFGETEEQINTFLFTMLRFMTAAVILSPVLFRKDTRELVFKAFKADLKTLLPVSVFGIIMESYLVFFALDFTTSARCSLMANTSPISTVILAVFLLKEKPTVLQTVGMLVGFAGVTASFFSQGGDMYAEASARSLIGDVMGLASGVCWSYFTVKGTDVSNKYGGLVCMFVCFTLSAFVMIPVSLISLPFCGVGHMDLRTAGVIVYTGCLTLGVANACWYGALRYLKPGVLGAYGYVSAALTFLLSAVMLKEHFTFLFVTGVVFIFAGVFLMMKKQKERKADV